MKYHYQANDNQSVCNEESPKKFGFESDASWKYATQSIES
jgi:hypothetical protein